MFRLASDYEDAKRWVGKAIATNEAGNALQDRLGELEDMLNSAHSSYESGDYSEARSEMEEAVELGEKLVGVSGWPSSGYNYQARFEDESLPAMERLLDKYREQEEEVANL